MKKATEREVRAELLVAGLSGATDGQFVRVSVEGINPRSDKGWRQN